jgi:hypothetical protein
MSGKPEGDPHLYSSSVKYFCNSVTAGLLNSSSIGRYRQIYKEEFENAH